jgi:D-tyrosyl-tRNA(Tyr) deacylase
MMGLLQRVTFAEVLVEGQHVASINDGLVVLIGVERGDAEAEADRLAERLIGYRVFADQDGKMNLSVADVNGALLLVPQFTLPADTNKGTRPSFTPAAPPDQGERLFDYLVKRAKARHPQVETGRFGAHMAVTLTNDGPVTFMLQVPPRP